ncbi:type II secretion system F family protein [Silanimonas sp.]|uniref:type II secretion system F family protein n=1 Tax=Silanimonas sp. TaxID=1929290 RepID=UPI0037C79DDE
MALFRYKALSAAGEALAGTMEAVRAEDVVARLQEQGHLPLDVGTSLDEGAGAGFAALFRKKALDEAAVLQFTQQLATLLGAGQALDRALGTLLDLPDNPQSRRVIERIRDAVRGGLPLSAALEQQHGLFSRLYVNLVRAGEAGGGLQVALLRLGEYLERAAALKAQVISALIYPILLLVMVLAVCALLLGVVVPQFNDLLASTDVTLPWYTQLVLGSGMFVRTYGLYLFIAGAVALLLAVRHFRQPEPRARLDAWLLGRPRIGELLARYETARFARTLGTLLGNGVPLLNGLGIARQVMDNRALGAALERATDEVKTGQGLAFALSRTKLFPRLAVQMVQVGEESGELGAMLLKVADTFDAETQRAIQRALAALVPFITVLMALLVGVVIMAVLVPIYQLTSSAGVL